MRGKKSKDNNNTLQTYNAEWRILLDPKYPGWPFIRPKVAMESSESNIITTILTPQNVQLNSNNFYDCIARYFKWLKPLQDKHLHTEAGVR